MAKKRYINTRFWDDTYISSLNPMEKLLFLYFITNQRTDICGIYEIPIKSIVSDTGIEDKIVLSIMEKFSTDKKIFYVDGWVSIKNFAKHQAVNPKIEEGIKRSLADVPTVILNKIDSLSIAYDSLSIDCQLLKPKLKPQLKPKPYIADTSAREIPDLTKDKNKHIRIIGYFITAKNIKFQDVDHQRTIIKRHLRPAQNLTGYDEEKIIDTMNYLVNNADFKWTIETVGKYIDENLQNLNTKKSKNVFV